MADLDLSRTLIDLPPARLVSAGADWDNQVYGDVCSHSPRESSTSTYAMSSGSTTLLLLLGKVPAGQAIAGFRMGRTVAPVTTGGLTAALFSAASLASTSWARAATGNVAVATAGTGIVATPYAVPAQTSDMWWMLQLVLSGTVSTYPTYAAKTGLQIAAMISPAAAGSAYVVGTSTGVTAPAATLNPTTGWAAPTAKPWAALY